MGETMVMAMATPASTVPFSEPEGTTSSAVHAHETRTDGQGWFWATCWYVCETRL